MLLPVRYCASEDVFIILVITAIVFSLFHTLGTCLTAVCSSSGVSEIGSGHYVKIDGSFIAVGNDYVEIVITLSNNTGGGIHSIKDKLRGVDFVRDEGYVNIGLFALEYWYDPIN